MTDVFVSYSPKDKVFVERLRSALTAPQRETWVDWEGIPCSAEWWEKSEPESRRPSRSSSSSRRTLIPA
jgi:hypothetical protein